MNAKRRCSPILSAALLFASVTLALLLATVYVQGRSFYLQLNATRLDPLGLRVAQVDVEPDRRPIVLIYGDSRAAEWSLPASKDETQWVKRGVASQTSAQLLLRAAHQLYPLRPDVVVIQGGINDLKTIPIFPDAAGRITADTLSNMTDLATESRKHGICVVVTTVFPTGPVPWYRRPFWSADVESSRRELNNQLMRLTGRGVTVLDSDEYLNTSSARRTYSTHRDLLHLTPHGYAEFEQPLLAAVADLLEAGDCGFVPSAILPHP